MAFRHFLPFLSALFLVSIALFPHEVHAEKKGNFAKSIRIDGIIVVRDNMIITSSDIQIFTILTSCLPISAEILNIQEEHGLIFLGPRENSFM